MPSFAVHKSHVQWERPPKIVGTHVNGQIWAYHDMKVGVKGPVFKSKGTFHNSNSHKLPPFSSRQTSVNAGKVIGAAAVGVGGYQAYKHRTQIGAAINKTIHKAPKPMTHQPTKFRGRVGGR